MIATDILTSFSLDNIIVVPAAIPPHKPSDFMADISSRLEMTRLAFAGLPWCRVSDIEATRSGRSYTIDTVTYFLKKASSGTELLFIVGLDAFLELDTWKNHMKLIKMIPFVVINRPLSKQNEQEALASFLALKISKAYAFSPEKSVYLHTTLQPIYFHNMPAINISSTLIRNRLKTGRPVRDMIPESVEQFIIQKGLYQ